MNDGSFLMYGCSQWSTNADRFSVILPQLDTIGRMLGGFFLQKVESRVSF